MAVAVSTPVFEGPVDVLLQLVGDHRIDVYDVPLAAVAAAFVAHLAEHPDLDLEETTEFLVIVAILVELKSRKLLPGPDEVDEDEEIDGFEERDRLLGRLLELQAYGAAADVLAGMMERAARSLPRQAGLDEPFRDLAPDLLAGVTVADLAAAYRRALTPRPAPTIDLSHVTVEPVTVSEAVDELVHSLPSIRRSTFRELTWHCTTRMQIIVRFLGLLELCKRGWITLEQGDTFGDLEVVWVAEHSGVDAPGVADGAAVEEYEG
jgi:segregation and condensation protein A